MWSDALVDNTRLSGNIYESGVNTAIYVANSRMIYISDYFERCNEGIIADGSYFDSITVDGSVFYGMTGSNWGTGKFIHILPTASTRSEIVVKNVPSLNARVSPNAGILASAGVIRTEQFVGPSATRVSVAKAQNNALWQDPFFIHQYISIATGAGISSTSFSTDSDGFTNFNISGTGAGLGWNGVTFRLYPLKYTGTFKIGFEYIYTGTATNFQPFGVYLGAPVSGIVGPTITPTTQWTYAESYAQSGASVGFFAAQGGFDGTVSIRKLYASAGDGDVYNYTPQPDFGMKVDSAPSSGTWKTGDAVLHGAPSAGGNIGWVCVSGGSPCATWKTFGSIAP